MDYANISIKPNGKAKNITISSIDNVVENISGKELNDIEYILMHEAVNSGKNVRRRVCSKKF